METGGPKSEDEASIEGAKRPRIEDDRSPNRRRSPRKGEGAMVWGKGSVSPSPENFLKFQLTTVQFGVYLERHLII